MRATLLRREGYVIGREDGTHLLLGDYITEPAGP
jgi:hypothetical protein